MSVEGTLSPRTLLALAGLTITLVCTAVGATLWLGNQFEGVGNEVTQVSAQVELLRQELNKEIAANRHEIEDLKNNVFTLATASENALRLAIENPGLRVPDPRNPKEIIRVRSEGEPQDEQ